MTPQELIKYELPSITEWISWGWLQTIIARYYSKKTMRKYTRYMHRLHREQWLKERGLIINITK